MLVGRRSSVVRLPLVRLSSAAVVLLAVVAGAPPAARADTPPAGSTLVGTVVRAYVEHRDQQDAAARDDFDAPLTYVDPGRGPSVRVPTSALADVQVGATVAVTVGGAVTDSAVTGDHLDPAQQVLSASVVAPAPPGGVAALPATPAVTDTVSIAMVVPAGATKDAATLSTVVSQVSGPVADFWSTQSNGQVQLAVADTHDWGTTSVTEDCSDPEALWDDVAAQIGFTRGPGKHLLLYVPSTDTQCSYGLAEVGSTLHAGGYAYVKDTVTSVIAHELGHNFGLLHSGRTSCRGVVEGTTCQSDGYGDLYDVMGYSWSQVGSLNSVQAARLGFLPADQVQDVGASDAPVSYPLAPLSAASGVRALRLTGPTGAVYYLEYRAPSGRDAWLGDPVADSTGLPDGVLIRQVDTVDATDSSMLFDATPSLGLLRFNGEAFTVGAPTVVAGTAFTVTVTAESPTAATLTIRSSTPLEQGYDRLGGSAGYLGTATGSPQCGLRDGGCFQAFQGGVLYWSPASGAHAVRPVTGARWAASGWENGLGYPVTDTVCGLRDGGCFQSFQGGTVYVSPASGAHVVGGALGNSWAATGWESGWLGYPVTDLVCGLRDGGCFQGFQGGAVYVSPASGAHAVGGAFANRWAAAGWENGALGYPVTDSVCGLRDGGCFEGFQGGALYWTPATGARIVAGAVRDRWAAAGWENGLGYPVTDTMCGLRDGGCAQGFQYGAVYFSPASGAHVVAGAVADRWAGTGWENGWLGYPVTDTVCGLRDGGCGQGFQGGSVYFSPAFGAHVVGGAIRDRWAAAGWENGALGYPVTDPWSVLGGQAQRFAGGTLQVTWRTGRVRWI